MSNSNTPRPPANRPTPRDPSPSHKQQNGYQPPTKSDSGGQGNPPKKR
jgi:hypothetical protein